jgi:hypothetical protein
VLQRKLGWFGRLVAGVLGRACGIPPENLQTSTELIQCGSQRSRIRINSLQAMSFRGSKVLLGELSVAPHERFKAADAAGGRRCFMLTDRTSGVQVLQRGVLHHCQQTVPFNFDNTTDCSCIMRHTLRSVYGRSGTVSTLCIPAFEVVTYYIWYRVMTTSGLTPTSVECIEDDVFPGFCNVVVHRQFL